MAKVFKPSEPFKFRGGDVLISVINGTQYEVVGLIYTHPDEQLHGAYQPVAQKVPKLEIKYSYDLIALNNAPHLHKMIPSEYVHEYLVTLTPTTKVLYGSK
jgi:hypothetical protein